MAFTWFHHDHLTPEQRAWVESSLGTPEGFYIRVLALPDELPAVRCGLYGPSEGDQPVADSEVRHVIRGSRSCASRVVERPYRDARHVIVIGLGERIFTAYGSITGSVAEREPGDLSLDSWEAIQSSRAFWATHALCAGE